MNEPIPSNMDIINVLKNSNLTPSQKVSVITEINNKNQPSKSMYNYNYMSYILSFFSKSNVTN